MKKKFFSNKIIYCSAHIWRRVFLFKKNFVFKTSEKLIYDRSSTIPRTFKGLNVKIHNGKIWNNRFINRWRVGFKFGEFTWNKRIALYKAKQLKKKK